MTSASRNLFDLAAAYWTSATLNAAVELGVFLELESGPAGVGELAGKLDCSPAHLDTLLDALASICVLRKSGNRYEISPDYDPFLRSDSPVSLLDALRFNAELYSLWGRAAQCIRKGRALVPAAAHLGTDAERTRRFVAAMESKARATAGPLVKTLNLDGVKRLLDLASGPGTLSRMLAMNQPGLHVTMFDLPGVLDCARNYCQSMDGTLDRISFHPGDYHTADLPGGFDAVLYSGALHQHSPDAAMDIFAKAKRALAPGGRMIVIDLMTDATRTSPAFSVMFGLSMLLTTPGARVYESDRVEAMLREAGFARTRTIVPPDSIYWIVEGW